MYYPAYGSVPSGTIAIWTGTIASIPAGWLICDGTNGTPNLLTYFLEGVATAATNPGTTGGGSATHTHGITQTVKNDGGQVPTSTYVLAANTGGASVFDKPKFYDVAFIMKS